MPFPGVRSVAPSHPFIRSTLRPISRRDAEAQRSASLLRKPVHHSQNAIPHEWATEV